LRSLCYPLELLKHLIDLDETWYAQCHTFNEQQEHGEARQNVRRRATLTVRCWSDVGVATCRACAKFGFVAIETR